MSEQIGLRSRNVIRNNTRRGTDARSTRGVSANTGRCAKGAPSFTSWNDKLRKRLRQHRRNKAEAHRTNGSCTEEFLASPSEILDEQVHNAIGIFWVALRRMPQPGRVVFGYGTSALFMDGRKRARRQNLQLTVCGTVPTSDTFVMPLLFPPEELDKLHIRISQTGGEPKEIGHFVLAVSSRDPERPREITTTIMDSGTQYIEGFEGLLRSAYQGLVQHGGWLGVNGEGEPESVQPIFAPEVNVNVPTQQGKNTCGLYVILNAWAHMLRIPITATPGRRNRRTSSWRAYGDFHTTAREIINLAWEGHMDSETVQAFMNVYGYAKQNLRAEERKPLAEQVRKVNTIKMDAGTLQTELAEQHLEDAELALRTFMAST